MRRKNKKLTLQDVKVLFETNLSNINTLAVNSQNVDEFKKSLNDDLRSNQHNFNEPEWKNIMKLIENDGKTIYELSTEKEIQIRTISLLWAFLHNQEEQQIGYSVDFLMDIYKQFERLYKKENTLPDIKQIERWMKRWPSGLDNSVIEIRKNNKERIIKYLIEKIEKRHSTSGRYIFPEDCDYQQKKNMVETWWNDHRFHLAMAARNPKSLNQMLGGTLSEKTLNLYYEAQKKGIPMFITPYYLSLLNTTNSGYDDIAIRSYVMYSQELVDTFGNIHAWEKEDAVVANQPNAAGWLLPEGHNIHRRYPDVAILIPDSIGRACGGLCASCQRMYDFQSGRLNFDLDNLKPKETWEEKLTRLMEYFKNDTQLRDILITGGDALMSQNRTLRNILHAVYKMAVHKREENLKRPEGEKYAELKRVRLGSRLPVYLPMRMNEELVDLLKEFRLKAMKVGVKQFFIQTHFQTPLEVTPEARSAIQQLQSAGWTITNQLVYNVAASRRGHTAKLRQVLNKLGILCYYTFSVKGFQENYAVFTPNSRSIQEQHEEKILGKLDTKSQLELADLLNRENAKGSNIRQFIKEHNIPFMATDRNVLNLPGVGKSMTFSLIGITPDGCRLLEFDHDSTRRHSPAIKEMPKVYIKENKSILAYLNQLDLMGEDISQYESIWNYTEGQTEHRFLLYEYPEQEGNITTKYSNLECNTTTNS